MLRGGEFATTNDTNDTNQNLDCGETRSIVSGSHWACHYPQNGVFALALRRGIAVWLWTHVWDRGGDNFEALCHVVQSKCDWVIRASKLDCEIRRSGAILSMEDVLSDSELTGCFDHHLRVPSSGA